MLVQYPLRSLINSMEASARIGAQSAEAMKSRLEAAWQRDRDLPALVRRDKYFLALQQAVQAGEFDLANHFAELLQGSGCQLSNDFHFLWAQSLLELGENEAAVTQLRCYLANADAGEVNYYSALKLLLECELGQL